MGNITLIRRANLASLLQHFVHQRAAEGVAPKGLEQSFAASLQVSPSMLSQIKSARPIGDKLARQIEAACRQPAGWLDEERTAQGPGVAERQIMELAQKAWRAGNAASRKQLKAVLIEMAKGKAPAAR